MKASSSGRASALASTKAPSRPLPPPMLRRALLLTTCLALAATSLAGARTGAPAKRVATAPPPSFFISGRGWGHGIGMSQWGAYGFAQRGTAYDQILAHYYRTTTLGKAPVARIRVLLGEGKKALAVASDSPFSVRDGSGTVYQLQPGPYSFGARPEGQGRLGPAGEGARRPARLPARLDAAQVRRQAVPRAVPGQREQDVAAARQLGRARAVSLRGRAARGSVPLAGRGAEGAGRRRALVCARGAQERRVRRLRRHAQPGVRGHRRREADDERRRRRDRRPGAALRGQGRDHVLLLDLRRTHGVDRRRLGARGAGPLPRRRARPVRHRVAAPHLGAVPVHGREADLDVQGPGQAARRSRDAQPIAAGRRADRS